MLIVSENYTFTNFLVSETSPRELLREICFYILFSCALHIKDWMTSLKQINKLDLQIRIINEMKWIINKYNNSSCFNILHKCLTWHTGANTVIKERCHTADATNTCSRWGFIAYLQTGFITSGMVVTAYTSQCLKQSLSHQKKSQYWHI